MVVAPSYASARPFRPLTLPELREMARINRIDCTDMYMVAGNGHFGGSLSCTEIITALYFSVMRVDPENPAWGDRDRHIFSKGHAAPTLYSALIRRGFMPAAWIDEFDARVGARLMTHPSRRYQPGVDLSTGALGHGLSVAAGMALAGKMDHKDYRVFVLMGDGEINEGSVWEAAAAAAKYKLDNLVAIVDRNGLCVDGRTEDVMPMEPLKARWESFGWETFEADGHDFPILLKLLDAPRAGGSKKPRMIIAKTIKGRGVSFMEDVCSWHANAITPAQYALVMDELKEALR